MGAASWGPTYPMIPHIARDLLSSETAIQRFELPYVFLHPNFFLQNLARSVPSALQSGVLEAGAPGVPIAPVDVRDIGAVAARRVAMTAMPEMVGIFNGFGGGASVLVAGSALWPARSATSDARGHVTISGLSRGFYDLRAERGLSALPFAEVRPHVSHGSAALLHLGFGLSPRDAAFEELQRRYGTPAPSGDS